MKTLKLISVVILVFTLACSEDSSTAPENNVSLNGQTYTNGIIGFSIAAPADWELKTNQDVGGIKTLLIGTKSNYSGIAPSFNIISNDAEGMKTTSELLEASETYITSAFPGVTFEKLQTINLGGFDCGELVYSFNYNGTNLKQKQIVFVCGEKISIAITFTAGKYDYKTAEADFDYVLNTLKML